MVLEVIQRIHKTSELKDDLENDPDYRKDLLYESKETNKSLLKNFYKKGINRYENEGKIEFKVTGRQGTKSRRITRVISKTEREIIENEARAYINWLIKKSVEF